MFRDVYPGGTESRARPPGPGLVMVLSLFPLSGCPQCEKDLLGCLHLTEADSDGSSDLNVPGFWAAPTSSSPPGSAPLGPRFSPLELTCGAPFLRYLQPRRSCSLLEGGPCGLGQCLSEFTGLV